MPFSEVLNQALRRLKDRFFAGSAQYWEQRYQNQGNSGSGSYGALAEFKAQVLNQFIQEHQINSVIEFGCGDGHQLQLANYPNYTGIDVSRTALSRCQQIFSKDQTKKFVHSSEYKTTLHQLSLSLDVIYHLIEDESFINYMKNLFSSSSNFVIIYSSNTDKNPWFLRSHVKNRKFTNWIDENTNNWKLINKISNKHPSNNLLTKGSFADFYIYQKILS